MTLDRTRAVGINGCDFIKIDAAGLAAGFLEMFTSEERDVLRFGMLPAKKMECLEEKMREVVGQYGQPPKEVFGDLTEFIYPDATEHTRLSRKTESGKIVEWELDKAVSEAVRLVTVELYRQGDLVV